MSYRMIAWLHVHLVAAATSLRDQRGQGTVEYVGIILMIAVLLTAIIAVARRTGGLEQIPQALARQLKGAIEKVR
jgi:hypothetical protein